MKKIIYIIVGIILVAVGYWFIKKGETTPLPPKNQTTELLIVNNTKDSVLVYLTLSGYSDSLAPYYIQDVVGAFGITDSGLVGSFYVKGFDTLSYTPDLRLSGNLCFGAQPLNCPDSTWPTGTSFFECNLNCPQESLDISCVGGVSSLMEVKLIGGPNWVAAQYTDVRQFYNDSMYKNTNLIGVFPYGCTNCTNTDGKQPCQTPSEIPDSTHICNPTRAKNQNGGKVMLIFKGYTNTVICNK